MKQVLPSRRKACMSGLSTALVIRSTTANSRLSGVLPGGIALECVPALLPDGRAALADGELVAAVGVVEVPLLVVGMAGLLLWDGKREVEVRSR